MWPVIPVKTDQEKGITFSLNVRLQYFCRQYYHVSLWPKGSYTFLVNSHLSEEEALKLFKGFAKNVPQKDPQWKKSRYFCQNKSAQSDEEQNFLPQAACVGKMQPETNYRPPPHSFPLMDGKDLRLYFILN